MNIVSKKTVNDKEIGKITIADEVIATIAATAATEVAGVYCLPSNVKRGTIINWISKKNVSKDCSVEVAENEIYVDISLIIYTGHNIIKTSEEVQEKVKNALEVMTGMTCKVINVNIIGVLDTTEN